MLWQVLLTASFFSASLATPFLKNVDTSEASSPQPKLICGGTDLIELDSTSDYGFISSPGYPGNYPDSIFSHQDCGSQITVANNEIDSVVLGFLQVRLNDGDYLSVKETHYNPPSESTDQFTGSFDLFLPELIIANETLVYLQSDVSDSNTGFLAAYAGKLVPNTTQSQADAPKEKPENADLKKQVIRVNVATGEVWTDSKNPDDMVKQTVQHVPGKQFGVIMSPFHPLQYPINVLLDYQLVVPHGARIALRFLRADFEVCCDYVSIHDSDLPMRFIQYLEPTIIYSSGSEILLRLHSIGTTTRTGFLVAYTAIYP